MQVTQLRFSPDGHKVASASDDLSVCVWDAATGKQVCKLAGHSGHISALEYVPSGRWLVTASWDGSIRIWDPKAGHQVRTSSA